MMFVSNIPNAINAKLNHKLHNKIGHPLNILKNYIYTFFGDFKKFDDLPNIVNIKNNFDDLLIPLSHPSRKMTDTYYVTPNTVLRTHTSAHQTELLAQGERQFLVSGDVYRKDEIDAHHYNIFHQMECVKCFHLDDNIDPENDLKQTLCGLIKYLFPGCQYRINNDYFPFTNPSFEIEVLFNGKWMEVLGCGVIHQNIFHNLNLPLKGWAFGLGLERLAMILFDIPDIRLFWSDDPRFTDQFKNGIIIKFIPFPKLNSITKDISFWIPKEQIVVESDNWIWNNINDFFEKIRDLTNDSINEVKLFDKYFCKKTNCYSMSFHIVYSPRIDQSNPGQFNSETNEMQFMIQEKILPELNLLLRHK